MINRLQKPEIITIMSTPFSMLSRREMQIRKLLTKIHDDPDIIKRKFAAAAYGFDPHLAERVRSKNFKAYTKDEREWVYIDKILHPEVSGIIPYLIFVVACIIYFILFYFILFYFIIVRDRFGSIT